jgi:hypothetical protein
MLDCVQKKAAKFANHTNDSDWETLSQRRKIACICTLFIACTGEWAWKSTGDRLEGPCYLSRDDHDCKIRVRKQRTDIGRYSFVNRSVKLWNQLPAEALVTFPWKSHISRKRVRKVIVCEEKWRVFCSVVTERPKVQGHEKCGVKCSEVQWSEVKWSEVMIVDEICLLSLLYIYVAVCRFCVVHYLIIICFYLLFSNYLTCVF